MYKTIKLHLLLTSEQKQILLLYESVYHHNLQTCMDKIKRQASEVRFADQHFTQDIAKTEYWLLYKMAKKKALYLKNPGPFHKSSVWSVKGAKLINREMILSFGKQFIVKEERFKTSCDDVQWQNIVEAKIMRIDILHDEHFWFANILLYEVHNSNYK